MNLPEDIFVTDGFPEHTYVPLREGQKEKDLLEGLAQKNKVISISGPSKSGKTTLCRHVIDTSTDFRLVYITGDSIEEPRDLWDEAIKQVRDDTDRPAYEISHADKVAMLVDREAALVIDDFHYIKREIQPRICQQIKNAASSGLRIVCLTVPHRGDDAIRGNPDLSGRFFSVDFEYWKEDDLLQIPLKGFPACGTSVPKHFSEFLSIEALRSPQIMQTLCLETCRALPQDQPVFEEVFGPDLLQAVKQKALRSYNRQTELHLLRQGPPTRGSDRKLYTHRDGSEADIYRALVDALKLDPPFLTLSLEEVRARVEIILNGIRPDNIRSSLQQYGGLFQSGQPPLDWDDEKRSLSIVDPHFYFYLRNER